jgi:hypothetical protein
MAKTYSGGVSIATGFKLNDPQPIVDYMVVDFNTDLMILPNQFIGMTVFVKEANSLYVKKDGGWGKVTNEELEILLYKDVTVAAIVDSDAFFEGYTSAEIDGTLTSEGVDLGLKVLLYNTVNPDATALYLRITDFTGIYPPPPPGEDNYIYQCIALGQDLNIVRVANDKVYHNQYNGTDLNTLEFREIQENVIEEIQVNGTALEITDKTVNIDLTEGHSIYANEDLIPLPQQPNLRFKGVIASDGTNETIIEGLKGEDGYTPVKGVDYFDGTNGQDGQDGYTPIKGVDYFDGQDGAQGPAGPQGEQGTQGEQGIQGIQGPTGATGEQGIQGPTGEQGITSITSSTSSSLTGFLKSNGSTVSSDTKVVILGTCSTARTTVNKEVTIDNYIPTIGDILAITFTDGFSINNATLNINGTGAVNIRVGGVNVSTSLLSVAAATSFVLLLYYDGSFYNVVQGSTLNSVLTAITTAEIDAGTSTNNRSITGQRSLYIIDKASPLTTKGDMLTYSTTRERLPIGNNGEVLIVDDTTSTGLKWTAPPIGPQGEQGIQGIQGEQGIQGVTGEQGVNILAAAVGSASYQMVHNKDNQITGTLPASGNTTTFLMPTMVSNVKNEFQISFKTNTTLCTFAFDMDSWSYPTLLGSLPTWEADKYYTVIIERVKIGVETNPPPPPNEVNDAYGYKVTAKTY